jgi:transcriptional regulator with XRE-family HTH domain
MAAAMGRAIQVVRTDRGWSRKEFAARTGLSYSYLSEIENGVKEPSSRTFAAIADALDVAPGALLYDAERRLIEVGSDSGGESPAHPGPESETDPASAEPTFLASRTPSVERLEHERRYFADGQPSSDTPPAASPTGDSGPRIQRSRRVLDWLAGPLARRSSEDSTPTGASPSRARFTGRGDPSAPTDLAAQQKELRPAASVSSEGSAEQLLDALLPLLGELSPEDCDLVLDLARRLALRESES